MWDLPKRMDFRPLVSILTSRLPRDGSKLAAIMAPAYGRWTVALDGVPWQTTFSDMVTDLVFSPDGDRLAALAKDGDHWMVVVDGTAWRHDLDMATT